MPILYSTALYSTTEQAVKNLDAGKQEVLNFSFLFGISVNFNQCPGFWQRYELEVLDQTV